jgi:hypothetical protein
MRTKRRKIQFTHQLAFGPGERYGLGSNSMNLENIASGMR